MKKICLSLIHILFLYGELNAQCSISSRVYGGQLGHEAAFEKIYSNADLENGILRADIKLTAIEEEASPIIGMSVIVMNKRPKIGVVSRQVIISYTDGSNTVINANTHNLSEIKTGIYGNLCNYTISITDFQKIKDKSVKQIVLLDNRSNDRIICQPYKDLLKEQANCIVNVIGSKYTSMYSTGHINKGKLSLDFKIPTISVYDIPNMGRNKVIAEVKPGDTDKLQFTGEVAEGMFYKVNFAGKVGYIYKSMVKGR
jgi:hypothetical protein